MRARTAVLLLAAVFLTSASPSLTPVGRAADLVLAQETESEGSEEGGEGADGNEGSGGTEAEVGAEEGQTESAEETETGPPWTYQMARMVLVLVILIAVAIGLLYWRLVVQRQRRGI